MKIDQQSYTYIHESQVGQELCLTYGIHLDNCFEFDNDLAFDK